MNEKLKIYCRENGHDWYIGEVFLWDRAKCLTCGEVIWGIILKYEDLPEY